MVLKQRTKNILAILTAGVLIYISGYALVGKVFVPQSFNESRSNAFEISEKLVSLLNESNLNLEKINDLDRKYEYQMASEMVIQELQRSAEINSKALDLSNEFSLMAESLGAANPAKARNLADSAIKDEVLLIGKIIEYKSSLENLLTTLKLKFSEKIEGGNDVQEIIKVMNLTAEKINELNSSYNTKMEEFDKITK